jgi:hypothetical protein
MKQLTYVFNSHSHNELLEFIREFAKHLPLAEILEVGQPLVIEITGSHNGGESLCWDIITETFLDFPVKTHDTNRYFGEGETIRTHEVWRGYSGGVQKPLKIQMTNLSELLITQDDFNMLKNIENEDACNAENYGDIIITSNRKLNFAHIRIELLLASDQPDFMPRADAWQRASLIQLNSPTLQNNQALTKFLSTTCDALEIAA